MKLVFKIIFAVLTSSVSWNLLAAASLPNIVIDDTDVYPESVTSTKDGRVFIGSVKGNVYRAGPGENKAVPFIEHSEENGILTILGVLADEKADRLWLCSVPNFFGPERSQGVTSLMAFDLTSGEQLGVWEFPEPAGVCNDITIAADGTAYASDTPNGRIFTLAPGDEELTLLHQDKNLVGIDGLAFNATGDLYVNNVRTNQLFRVDIKEDGSFPELVELEVSHKLGGPDSMRLIEGNRFLQAESTIGRLSIVTIENDKATLKILKADLMSSPGATPVGDTAYVIESNIQFLINPDLRGQDPGDFVIHAVPMD